MGKWRLRDINPRPWLIAMLAACLIVQFPFIIHPGQASGLLSANNSRPYQTFNGRGNQNTFYLTGNVTVQAGQNYTISNENLLLESLYEGSMGITVFGNLTIVNSTLSLYNASYSVLSNFSIYLQPGSNFTLEESSLTFPGLVDFNHTTAKIENSSLNTSVSVPASPYDSSLRISALDSEISIANSTINGLYRQNGTHEYVDGYQYLYSTPYSSSNSTITMTPATHLREDALVNSVIVNVTYNSRYNESNNYLKIGYNGSLMGEYTLPFNLTEKQATMSIEVNFTGREHNLSWIESSADFYLISVVNSQTPVTIYNLTEYFLSNDTVSLYGNGVFSYNFTNSNITIYNSSLGVNEAENILGTGQWNPGKLYISLVNTTLILADSSLVDPGSYRAPFFINHNSRIYFVKTVVPMVYSHNIPVDNVNFSISPFDSQALTSSKYFNALNSTGNGWLYNSRNASAVYETVNISGIFNYTDTFGIATDGDIGYFSISPFPALVEGALAISLNAPSVPYSTFTISGFNLSNNGTGTFSLNWQGNLSGLGNITATWVLYNSTSDVVNGFSTISNPGTSMGKTIQLASGKHLGLGSYFLHLNAGSKAEHAFNNSGVAFSTFVLEKQPPVVHEVRITRLGNVNGMVWGISIGNHSIYTNGTAITTDITENTTAEIVAPQGFTSSPMELNLSTTDANYTVSFTMVQYEVIFDNPNVTNGKQWELLIAGESFHTSNNTIQVYLQPGSYNYEAIDPNGFSLASSTGIIRVYNSSLTVDLHSEKIIPWTTSIERHLVTPEYYIPSTIALVAAIAIAGWSASHSWYVCRNCGSTRKRRKQKCPYCGQQ